MVKLIDSLREQFDYIILDCPAGIEQGFQNAIAGADHAIVVTTPEVSAIRDADRIIGLLEANEIKKVDLVLNRLRQDLIRRGEMMTVDDVLDILGLPLLGVVPDDENVVIATNQGEPLVGMNSFAGQAYMSLFSIFKRKTSSQIAKDRLKILLISDRVNCSPEMMELIKNDIAQVISKYMQIDASSMEVQIAKTGTSARNGKKTPVLYANIPILDLRS